MSNNKYKILLVEDESNISNLVSTILEASGYYAIVAGTCSLALSLFQSHIPDLVILDLGLPDRDGMYFLQTIRQNHRTPIIVLSARANEKDKVDALDAGANDYVTKPFGSEELLARVRSALRNSHITPNALTSPDGTFVLRDLVIRFDARRVFIGDNEIRLTQTEYNILSFLAEHAGKMMTYAAIIKAVWGGSDEGSIKKLQVNMANIRKKFGAKPGEENYIINELGVGYRLNIDKKN